jgi:NIMA (never in mitosis gene a)-related kinase
MDQDFVLNNIFQSQIRNWLVQVAFALQYLHKNNILHRDLKPKNIFMTRAKLLKLGDFGISKTLSNENDFASTPVGISQYLSPEICMSVFQRCIA